MNRILALLLLGCACAGVIWFARRDGGPSIPGAEPHVQPSAPVDGAAAADVLQPPPAVPDQGEQRAVEPARKLHEVFTRIPALADLEVQPPQGPDGRCNGCLCVLKPPTLVWTHYWLDQLKTNRRGEDAMQVLEKFVLYREHCIGRGWTSMPAAENGQGDYVYGWNGYVYSVRKRDYPLLDRYENLRMDANFDQKAAMEDEKVREVSCYIEEGLKDLPTRLDI